jgi:hypothetical protein
MLTDILMTREFEHVNLDDIRFKELVFIYEDSTAEEVDMRVTSYLLNNGYTYNELDGKWYPNDYICGSCGEMVFEINYDIDRDIDVCNNCK